MIKTLHIKSLSNSIPFYNGLMNMTPVRISHNSAQYIAIGIQIELRESLVPVEEHKEILAGSIYIAKAVDFKKRFRNVIRFHNHFRHTHCKVLERSFQVSDPDGYIWLITNEKTHLPSVDLKINQCYLEPINF